MNQEQIKEEKSSIVTLLLSSILLHMLLLLAIVFYRLAPDLTPEKIKISPHDNVVLWTSPTQTILQQQPPAPQKEAKKIPDKPREEKKEEPDANFLKKAPIITPGRQGIDEQNTSGAQTLVQTTEKVQKEEPITLPEQKKPELPPASQPKSEKIIESLPSAQKKPQEIHESAKSPISFKDSEASEKILPEKQPLKFDTNLSMFSKAKLAQHQNTPQITQKNSIKSISFKDISLGFNNAATNIGNSQHLMIQGTSPDIPQGDELKYITFISQMANMIVASIHANPKINLVSQRTNEKLICFMKVNRSGQLLDTHMIIPSTHEIINMIIIDSIQNVGLFNPIPKFIQKDTFEINWHILT